MRRFYRSPAEVTAMFGAGSLRLLHRRHTLAFAQCTEHHVCMSKLARLLIGATLFPGAVMSGDLLGSPCVDALEQVMTLKTDVAVYKQLPGGERHYLEDAARPAELARISAIVAASCSSDPAARAAQQTGAEQLHRARSPECAVERDKLSAMESPDSRDARDSIAAQRELVTAHCPTVPMAGAWLLQMVWAKP